MPFTNATQFTVVSYDNLGGLGAREGLPTVYTWEPPPPEPPEMPAAASGTVKVFAWLLLLLPLFLFRQNRSPKAWWIWLPLGVTALVGLPLVWLTSDGDQNLLGLFCGCTAGLGAVWLLTPWLASRYRVVMFLKTLPLLAGASMVAYVPTFIGGSVGGPDFWPYMVIFLGCAGFVVAAALALTGFCVRRRFGRIRFVLWLVVWVVPAWAASLILIMALLGGGPGWEELLIGGLIVSGITVAMLLPLVLLSFFQPFYRTRFSTWLNLPRPQPPPLPRVPPPLVEIAQAPANM